MKNTRQEVYAAIDSEREYQNTTVAERFGRQFDRTDSLGGHLAILQDYYNEALHAWAREEGDVPCLNVVRKLAGIVTRCLEQVAVPLWMGKVPATECSARYLVYCAFDAERTKQLARWGELDKINRVGDFLCYIKRYIDRAVYECNPSTPGESCAQLIKVGALCIAAMESLGAHNR